MDKLKAWLLQGSNVSSSSSSVAPVASSSSSSLSSSAPVAPVAPVVSSSSSSSSSVASTLLPQKKRTFQEMMSVKPLVRHVVHEDKTYKLPKFAHNAGHVRTVSDWIIRHREPLLWMHGVTGSGKSHILKETLDQTKTKAIPIDIDNDFFTLEYLIDLSNTRERSVFVLDNVSLKEDNLGDMLKQFLKLWKLDDESKLPVKKHFIQLVLITEESFSNSLEKTFFTHVSHLKIGIESPSFHEIKSVVTSICIGPDSIGKQTLTKLRTRDKESLEIISRSSGCNWFRLARLLEWPESDYTLYIGESDFQQFKMLLNPNLTQEKWDKIWKRNEDRWTHIFCSNMPWFLGGQMLDTTRELLSCADYISPNHQGLDIRGCIVNGIRKLPTREYISWNQDMTSWNIEARMPVPDRIEIPKEIFLPKPRYSFECDILALRRFVMLEKAQINLAIKTPKKRAPKKKLKKDEPKEEKKENRLLLLMTNDAVLRRMMDLSVDADDKRVDRWLLENPMTEKLMQLKTFMSQNLIQKLIKTPDK